MPPSASRGMGLPPLVRGAPMAVPSGVVHRRPTPAGAGSTPNRIVVLGPIRAYPRWCGEHSSYLVRNTAAGGLPPLVRGAPQQLIAHRFGIGPTPAGAGSTHCRVCWTSCPTAYPRWCGEHRNAPPRYRLRPGLPPLVRGAHVVDLAGHDHRGPTPAGAGSTHPDVACVAARPAYPRWCGEHCGGKPSMKRAGGLPPLVRGARRHRPTRSARLRPTPAGAGSTALWRVAAIGRGAYPRWCGEHHQRLTVLRAHGGLPPLVRGARTTTSTAGCGPRPTPAGAGSTRPTPVSNASPTAYPRWCGEHVAIEDVTDALEGLPPLVRGAP